MGKDRLSRPDLKSNGRGFSRARSSTRENSRAEDSINRDRDNSSSLVPAAAATLRKHRSIVFSKSIFSVHFKLIKITEGRLRFPVTTVQMAVTSIYRATTARSLNLTRKRFLLKNEKNSV